MEDRRADIAGGALQVVLRLVGWPRFELDRVEAGEGGLFDDLPRQADGADGDVAISLCGQVARPDVRCRGEVRAFEVHRAAAFRAQIANAGGDRRERMNRFAELVERDRLHVILQVGRFLLRAGPGEDPELAWCHRHRPGAFQQIFQPDRRLAEE
ncbi:hypothetical protein D9M72_408160 [compost metagenome]